MAKAKDTKEKVVKKEKKESLWARFMNFCHGVKVESKRIHWTTKKDLFRYSVATLIFVVFLSLFFYVIDIIFALLHSLF